MPKSTFFPHHSLSPFISVFSHTHSLLLPLFCFLSRSPTTTIYSLRREPHPTPTLSSLRCDPPHSPSSPSFSSTTCRDRFSAQQPKSVFFLFCSGIQKFLSVWCHANYQICTCNSLISSLLLHPPLYSFLCSLLFFFFFEPSPFSNVLCLARQIKTISIKNTK